jgi:hypothetical protein
MYLSDSDTQLTSNDVRNFEERLEALDRGLDDVADLVNSRVKDRVRRLAGEYYTDMMRSPEDAEKYLKRTEPALRQAALQVLYSHWGQREAYADRYERIAVSDSDTDVRVHALMLFGFCYSYTHDQRVSRFLADITLNEQEKESIRRQAYYSCLHVNGMAGIRTPFLRFPDDVNWGFVNKFISPGSKEEKGDILL